MSTSLIHGQLEDITKFLHSSISLGGISAPGWEKAVESIIENLRIIGEAEERHEEFKGLADELLDYYLRIFFKVADSIPPDLNTRLLDVVKNASKDKVRVVPRLKILQCFSEQKIRMSIIKKAPKDRDLLWKSLA